MDFKYQRETAPARSAEKTYAVTIDNGGSGYEAGKTVLKLGNEILDADLKIENGKITAATLLSTEALAKAANGAKLTIEAGGEGDKKGTGGAAHLTVQNKPGAPAEMQTMMLQVPLLTMMPIPFIRIATTDIEFNVKINSVNTTSSSQETNSNVESKTTASFSSWWSPVRVNTSFNATIASQKKTSSTEEIKKEFSLNIKVHAVQDDMPAGVSRILDILEESIKPQPVSA